MTTTFIKIVFGLVIITPPIVCFIIARANNRNQWRWFLYGLVFGIFAIIYLIFYTKEGGQDKIRPSVMALLCIFMILMLFSLYETFFGLVLK